MPKANLTREELAALLGLKTQTLATWACRNRGPRFWRRRKRVLYRAGDVAAWLADPVAYDAARATSSPS
jgi:transcriptional regulator with XRE-family HTH domain